MPHISLPSLLHLLASLLALLASLSSLSSLLSLRSAFPGDILEELEEISFEGFHSELGGHQTLVPTIVHLIHSGKVLQSLHCH